MVDGWKGSTAVESDKASTHAAISQQAQTPLAANTATHPDSSDARPVHTA